MPLITSFNGTALLESSTLEEIKKQADLLLKQKDVAGAWQAAQHIKKELSLLSAEKVSALLPEYRKISANLKALAFPLLEKEDAFNLIERNLTFLSPEYKPVLPSAVVAWLAIQENPQETRDKLLKLVETASPAASDLKAALQPQAAASGSLVAPAPKVQAAPSYEMFNTHERSELTEHVQKVNTIAGAPLAIDGVGAVVESIFESAKPNIDKEPFTRRAQALIASRLRDVRTTVQLNEYLARPFAVGGLGLEGAGLQQASRLIEQEHQKLHNSAPSPKFVQPVAEAPAVTLAKEPVLPSVSPVVEQPAEPKPAIKEIPVAPKPKIIAPSAPVALAVKSTTDFEMPRDTKRATIEPKDKIETKVQGEALSSLVRARNLAGMDRSRIEDIKTPSAAAARTLSAADEFKLLTLADFRGWGNGAAATGEIMRRMGLLAKESLSSKMQGAKQFRSSELFKDYVRIGQASLSAGKKLAEILSDKNINPNQMTEDEFFAIASLNSRLK